MTTKTFFSSEETLFPVRELSIKKRNLSNPSRYLFISATKISIRARNVFIHKGNISISVKNMSIRSRDLSILVRKVSICARDLFKFVRKTVSARIEMFFLIVGSIFENKKGGFCPPFPFAAVKIGYLLDADFEAPLKDFFSSSIFLPISSRAAASNFSSSFGNISPSSSWT